MKRHDANLLPCKTPATLSKTSVSRFEMMKKYSTLVRGWELSRFMCVPIRNGSVGSVSGIDESKWIRVLLLA